MFRFVSVWLRKKQLKKRKIKLLEQFEAWKLDQKTLPEYQLNNKKLLIIRLDDIGDYLLFRNTLPFYKTGQWQEYEITLLGNFFWKNLFDSFDRNTVDEIIWIDKKQYEENKIYRIDVWKNLREQGFEVVICPSRTRPILLDDLCTLASGAKNKFASENNLAYDDINKSSDRIYNHLYQQKNYYTNEFIFNIEFANWCCQTNNLITRPQILSQFKSTHHKKYIVCFIGASAQSKRWPEKNWMQLIQMLSANNDYEIFITGGKNEIIAASKIEKQTKTKNVANQLSLLEMSELVAFSTAVITNDSMALHLGVSFNKPTIVIANGDNAYRFTEYEKAGFSNIKALYPQRFLKEFIKKGNQVFADYIAVTADIATINPSQVFNALQEVIEK